MAASTNVRVSSRLLPTSRTGPPSWASAAGASRASPRRAAARRFTGSTPGCLVRPGRAPLPVVTRRGPATDVTRAARRRPWPGQDGAGTGPQSPGSAAACRPKQTVRASGPGREPRTAHRTPRHQRGWSQSCVEELGRARPSPCIEAEAGRSSRGPVRTTHTPEGPDDETDPTQDHPRGRRLGAAALAFGGVPTKGSAEQRVTVGLIGAGGMGTNHLRLLAARKDVEVAYVCDVDRNRLAEAASGRRERTRARPPRRSRTCARSSTTSGVDAVWIATPDHWHAPAAILALDAGKHVYVEKPCSHNIREGRLMVEAVDALGQASSRSARRAAAPPSSGRRSSASTAGAIGDVLVAKAWNSQRRGIDRQDASRADPPRQPRLRPLARPGARWSRTSRTCCPASGAGGTTSAAATSATTASTTSTSPAGAWASTTHPSRVACLGGKYFFDDDQQFPDTQYAVFEYPDDGKPGRAQAAHLRAADLVALRAGGLRERRRVLRHQGDADHRPHGRLEALRPAEQADRGTDRPGRPGGPPPELPRLHPRRRRSSSTPT